MSVGSEGAYDFILQDTENNPTVELGLVLAYSNEDQRKTWSEGRIPPLPPRRSSGRLDWTHKDPISDFVFSQSDWSGGGFKPYYEAEQPNKYAKSNGVDLRWEGVAALGPRRGPIRTGGTVKSKIQSNMFIANGDWEEGQVVGWSAGTGTTLTVESSTVRTGNYSAKAVVAQGTSAGAIISQSVPNPTVYRSRQIKVIAYLRRDSGSDAGVILRLDDGATQTDSSAVTAAGWTYVSVQATVGASISALTISVRTNGTTTNAAHTFYMDDCYVIPTGGVEAVGSAIRASTSPNEAYVALGRCVVRWSESTYAWEAVYINAAVAVTDIIEFNNDIYVAFGEPSGSTPYQYVYGSATTWTTAAVNGTTTHEANHARFWVKARNGYGEWALWKAGPSSNQGTERNRVAWATNPKNGGAWNPDTYFVVGSDNRNITGLYPFQDSFVIAKVDGIWMWDAMINDFIVITPEWEHMIDASNGAVGTAWLNEIYLTTVQQGFIRYSGAVLEDLSPLLMAPRLSDFGGRITAMAPTARELILGLDQPTADATADKTSRLVRLRPSAKNVWEIHTIQEPSIGLIDEITMHRDTRLWAIGRSYDANLEDYVPVANVWIEPEKVAAPYADATPAIEYTGTFDTSIWHGDTPETDKALIALTIWGEDLDSNHTIQAHFGRDGRAASDRVLGTFNGTDRVQTLFFKNIVDPVTNAVGRFFQLRFTLTTSDTTSPKLYAFALHTQLVPDPIKVFEVDVWVGGSALLRTGVPYEHSKSEMEDIFAELEAQVFPLTMLDDFGQSHGGTGSDGARVRQVRLTSFARIPETDNERGQERWRLTLQEVALK